MSKNRHSHKQPSSNGAEILRFADARRHRPPAETGFSDQIAALAVQLEAHGRDWDLYGRGGPVRIDRRWQRLTCRLKRLPRRRYWRKRWPRAANSPGSYWMQSRMRQPMPHGRHRSSSQESPPLPTGTNFIFAFLAVMMVTAAGALATDMSALYEILR